MSLSLRLAALVAALPAVVLAQATPPSPPATVSGDPRFGGYLDLNDNMLAGGAVARATLEGNRLAI